jgi:hypothetical protein
MDNDTTNTKANKNSENQYNWLHTILSIPKIGGLLTSIIAILPAALIFLIFSFGLPENEETLSGFQFFLIVIMFVSALIGTWSWLNYLERKIRLAIVLPIPFINIPIKWILYPFMLPFFGIMKIYRHFVPVHPVNKVDSLDILESENEL